MTVIDSGAAVATGIAQSGDKYHVPLLLLSPDNYPLKGTLFKFFVNIHVGKNLLPVVKSISPRSVQFCD